MKNSNKLLGLMVVILMAGMLSYAFHLDAKMTIVKYNRQGNNPLLPGTSFAEKVITVDTLHGEFHYLWTNFPGVWLDTKSEKQITTFQSQAGQEGYTFGKVDLIIDRDTLFIRHNLGLMTKTTTDDTTRVLQAALVSANQLKGIEVVGKGWVANVGRGVKVMASPSEQKKALHSSTYRFPGEHAFNEPLSPTTGAIELNFRQGGIMDLNIQADEIRVNATGKTPNSKFASLWLWGNCKTLVIEHQDLLFKTRAYSLDADQVVIDSEDPEMGSNTIFQVTAKKHLQANLQGWSNVLFLGDPKIEKRAPYGGRVVNANRY